MMALDTPDITLAHSFRNDLEKIGYHGKHWQVILLPSKRGSYITRLCSKKIIQKISYFATQGAHTWQLKNTFYQQHTPQMDIIFLKRVFDAEGSVSKSINFIIISITLVNETAISQISSLLTSLGVYNKYYKTQDGYFKLLITRQKAVEKFYLIVGFGLPRKQERLRTLMYEMWGSETFTSQSKRCPHCGKMMKLNRITHTHTCVCGLGNP
jgi:hypothetical protein